MTEMKIMKDIKDSYLDENGNDSLAHLRIASEKGCEYFVTTNVGMLEDRKELEILFNIKIRTPKEMKKERIIGDTK